MMSPGMHPVLAALQVIDDGLDELAEGNLWSLLDSESLEVRVELEKLASRLYAAKLRSTRDVEVRGAAVAAGATSLRDWLVNRVRLHPGEATREVLLAGQVVDDLPATAAALSAGEITPAAVTVIADTDAELCRFATAAQRADAETVLAEQARTLNVRHLQNAALHLAHRLDPDQGERLAKDEQEQVAKREFRLHLHPDGSSRPDGYLDKEATAFLHTALDPLAKPRPAADGERDPRSHPQRMGDALVELVELALRSGDLPAQAGQPVQLVVAINLDDLQGRLEHTGAGTLDSGLPLSAEATRRLACDCQVIPAVLGSHGEPLDMGRAMRDASPAIRRALDIRDGGCAFPGCDRPPKWCVVHHIWHWEDGGPTSCANCVLLCGHHHRVVHHHGWDVRIEADGLPSFYPPTWIDPDRAPRRNHRLKAHTPPPRGQPGDVLTAILPIRRT